MRCYRWLEKQEEKWSWGKVFSGNFSFIAFSVIRLLFPHFPRGVKIKILKVSIHNIFESRDFHTFIENARSWLHYQTWFHAVIDFVLCRRLCCENNFIKSSLISIIWSWNVSWNIHNSCQPKCVIRRMKSCIQKFNCADEIQWYRLTHVTWVGRSPAKRTPSLAVRVPFQKDCESRSPSDSESLRKKTGSPGLEVRTKRLQNSESFFYDAFFFNFDHLLRILFVQGNYEKNIQILFSRDLKMIFSFIKILFSRFLGEIRSRFLYIYHFNLNKHTVNSSWAG